MNTSEPEWFQIFKCQKNNLYRGGAERLMWGDAKLSGGRFVKILASGGSPQSPSVEETLSTNSSTF